MNKGKAHRLYTFNLFVSWCAAKRSLGSKVNSQLGSSKIREKVSASFRDGTGLLLALGVRIELPGSGIKIKKDQKFQNPDE